MPLIFSQLVPLTLDSSTQADVTVGTQNLILDNILMYIPVAVPVPTLLAPMSPQSSISHSFGVDRK